MIAPLVLQNALDVSTIIHSILSFRADDIISAALYGTAPGDIPQSEFAGAELDQNVQAVAEHRVAHNTGAPGNDGGHPARSTHLHLPI